MVVLHEQTCCFFRGSCTTSPAASPFCLVGPRQGPVLWQLAGLRVPVPLIVPMPSLRCSTRGYHNKYKSLEKACSQHLHNGSAMPQPHRCPSPQHTAPLQQLLLAQRLPWPQGRGIPGAPGQRCRCPAARPCRGIGAGGPALYPQLAPTCWGGLGVSASRTLLLGERRMLEPGPASRPPQYTHGKQHARTIQKGTISRPNFSSTLQHTAASCPYWMCSRRPACSQCPGWPQALRGLGHKTPAGHGHEGCSAAQRGTSE